MDLIWLAAFMVFDRGVKFGERVFAPKTKTFKKAQAALKEAKADRGEIEKTRQSGILKLSRTKELFEVQKRIDALNKKRPQYK